MINSRSRSYYDGIGNFGAALPHRRSGGDQFRAGYYNSKSVSCPQQGRFGLIGASSMPSIRISILSRLATIFYRRRRGGRCLYRSAPDRPGSLSHQASSQFDDMLARQNIDTMAGITSTLVRYPEIGMRGHIQVSFEPIEGKYRKRVS